MRPLHLQYPVILFAQIAIVAAVKANPYDKPGKVVTKFAGFLFAVPAGFIFLQFKIYFI